ncbi:MAG: peroxiredoxin family protein [Enterocloster sp.]
MLPAIDFTLKDQYGNTHSLSDYKGKTIFLNFWAHLVSALPGRDAGYTENI